LDHAPWLPCGKAEGEGARVGTDADDEPDGAGGDEPAPTTEPAVTDLAGPERAGFSLLAIQLAESVTERLSGGAT